MTLIRDLIADRAWGEMALWLALWVFCFLAGPVLAGAVGAL